MRCRFSFHRCWLAVIVLVAVCMPCWGQGNLRTILFVKLKLDQEDNWKAAVKDYVELVKKAGSQQQFTIWESQSGPSQYAVVWYSAKFKEMGEDNPKLKDSAADIESIFGRLNGQTESMERWIDEMQPDLGIMSNNIPAMVRTSRSRVLPGKMDEVKALFRDQIVPALKKSGAADFGIAVARFGTPSNEIHTYLGMSGWSDLDGPLGTEKGMTPAEWKAFQAKVPSLIESTDWDVWKYHPELSYIPAMK